MSDRIPHPFEARLGDWPDERLRRILTSRVRKQLAYFPAQIEMDLAHTVMLAEQDILTPLEASQILIVLDGLRAGGPDALPLTSTRSSLFWYVEAALIDRLGEAVGGKLQTGRSHNDIMPTVSRMTARRSLITLVGSVITLQRALLEGASEHITTVMPGYTALQHGQPWTYGHYLVGWCYAFARDVTRLRHAYENTNRSPLGASALAGASWPLNRRRTAELLGFDTIVTHSRDAGFGTRDYVAEILAAVGIAMTNLSSMCSDFYLWSSYEFSLIELGDAFSGTSSFMPQKKNAWAFDWVRGAAGNLIGGYGASLAAMRGSSSTDGSLQDYPEKPLADAFEVAIDYFDLIAAALRSVTVNDALMLSRARSNWATASNLAETIAREHGLSFRVAHAVVGRVVRSAIREGVAPFELSGAAVDRAAREIVGQSLGLSDEAVRTALDPVRFVETRVTEGSVNPAEVRAMITDRRRGMARDAGWLEKTAAHLTAAREGLDQEVARWMEADRQGND